MPVEPATLGAFAVAATALVVSPGPDTLIILRHAMGSGRDAGLAAVAGVQIGLIVHTALAVAGLSLVIAASPVLFKGVAVAGAAYLGWLGVETMRSGGAIGGAGETVAVGRLRACREAILCNLLNPKVILLYIALLPNFIDSRSGPVPLQLVTLAATLIVINILWQAPMAWTADAVRRWLERPPVRLALTRATGAVLILFALLMLTEHLSSSSHITV